MCGALPPTLYGILEYWNTMEYWNIRILGKWNIGILVTMEPRYIGILVYWYGILVYWNTRILDKHYLFLRFLDPSQVTIADWMPVAYMHT